MLAPDAVADLAPALKLLPNEQDAATRTTRGGLLLRAGKLAEAVVELEKAAAQRRPGEAPVADLLLAIVLHRQGETSEARLVLERARFILEQTTLRRAVACFGAGTNGPLMTAATAMSPASPPRWDWPTTLEVRLLRREAETLIEPAPPKPGQ
jgi:hypothetical protein